MSRNDALEIPRLNIVVGANAASRADMTVVANDTVCELVWSRRKGLIIRYAAPGNIIHSSLLAAATEINGDKHAEERTPKSKSGLEGYSGLEDRRMQKLSPESSSQCRELHQSKTLNKEAGENKSECNAENDLHGKEQVSLEVFEISKASPIRAFASETKGCHLKRVMSFEEQPIVGSKRLKMHFQETHSSASAIRTNSSFANWISTMIMDLPRSDTSERAISTIQQERKLASMGFQTIFESIYQPNGKLQDERSLRSEEHSSEANNNAVISNPGDLVAVQPNLDSDDDFGSSAVWNKERSKKLFGKVNIEIKESSTLIRKDDDVPTGIFEAVKRLRLSRVDIMKWMSSMFSSELDGYYLRLRVGKSGQGLGGASYQVACICCSLRGNLAETSKRPISVIVGGNKCLVECQYISNQDFLQDELKAWWTATLRDDGKIPSEHELRSKVEERRRLGL